MVLEQEHRRRGRILQTQSDHVLLNGQFAQACLTGRRVIARLRINQALLVTPIDLDSHHGQGAPGRGTLVGCRKSFDRSG